MRRSFQRFFRPISELGIHHVSSCNYLPLGPGQALSARGSIASRKKVAFFLCTFRFAPAERYETYTIL